jgi:hypothetical protein
VRCGIFPLPDLRVFIKTPMRRIGEGHQNLHDEK